jgi:hypothetical protein
LPFILFSSSKIKHVFRTPFPTLTAIYSSIDL